MPGIKAVLFDLDGKLIDTHDIILASMRHTVGHYVSTDIPEDVLMHGVGTPLWNQMLHFAGGPGNEQQADEMTAFYRQHNDAIHDQEAKEFPGISAMVEVLEGKGLRMGIVTGKRHALAVRGLQLFGLDRFMEFVIGSDDIASHKPEPGPVLAGCDRMGLTPQECVYVGDSPYDIASGNAAGCTTVAVTWGMFPLQELLDQHPDFVVDNPAQLAELSFLG